MPGITDTFNSINMIGWYGSVYFLAVGAAFPIFNVICHIVSRRWGGKGLLILVLAALVVFEGGSICCYFARNSALIILGRALCGTGSAGIMADITFTLVHSRLQGRGGQLRMGALLLTYALSRFVGPL
jgi:predicted MFS family arabinose efflux permease